MKVLCVGGSKHGEYVEVTDPYRGLFVPIVHPSRWLATGEEYASISIATEYYRMEKFALTGGFVSPVFVIDSLSERDMAQHIIPLIFKPEFLETRV